MLAGKRMRAPLMISPMTGGTERGLEINRRLAAAAERFGLAFGVGSQRIALEHPDRGEFFQVRDVAPNVPLFANFGAAQLVRGLLEDAGLTGCPKTTGGRGMHIYVPLDPVYTYDQVRAFAEILARLAERERPDLFTLPRAVSKREKGKVYFDYLQIARGKTISAPYVLRAHPGAPVATPLEWNWMRLPRWSSAVGWPGSKT